MNMRAAELIAIEKRFGGLCVDVPRRKVSPHDGRSRKSIKSGGMQGGDRMLHHGYAEAYAEFLPRQLPIASVVVELGILRGHGLALLSELYGEDARIVGLDVDLSHYAEHYSVLKGYGAFSNGDPQVMEFDELSGDAWDGLAREIPPRSVAIWIDDALHDDESIIAAALRSRPFMAKGGLYFIEDNHRVADRLKRYLPSSAVHVRGRLTVIAS